MTIAQRVRVARSPLPGYAACLSAGKPPSISILIPVVPHRDRGERAGKDEGGGERGEVMGGGRSDGWGECATDSSRGRE